MEVNSFSTTEKAWLNHHSQYSKTEVKENMPLWHCMLSCLLQFEET